MILTDTRILEEIQKGTIVISPFDRNHLGSNSYDVHLGKHLAVYKNDLLDARVHNNTWTLEISVKQAVRVYHGRPIGQLIYFEVSGEIGTSYGQKASAKYATRTDRPVESMMWKNFPT